MDVEPGPSMGWRSDEVWLETDVLWFREQPRVPFGNLGLTVPAMALAGDGGEALALPRFGTGLEESRRRRLEAQAARRRHLASRTVPAVALVLGSATMLPMYAMRQLEGEGRAGPLQEDPPSLTFRFDTALETLEAPVPRPRKAAAAESAATEPAKTAAPVAPEYPRVEWSHATSHGVPFGGSLTNGTQLPIEGANWVTWNPVTDSVVNEPYRLYGNERTIRAIVSIANAYRTAHPEAPRVVVGDISFRHGGRMDEHVSHQNGLDVDVYYPRTDRHLSAPITPSQVDRELTQDLLDRFVAAGAQMIFVGYQTGLRGPSGVVVPYPNHENHMHVRFPNPG
jgi:murein endopeptidase